MEPNLSEDFGQLLEQIAVMEGTHSPAYLHLAEAVSGEDTGRALEIAMAVCSEVRSQEIIQDFVLAHMSK